MTRVDVSGRMFAWARDRSGVPAADLLRRFPQLDRWERGEVRPTLKQLDSFAAATYVPVGYFFLPEPPVERLPLPDFRTMRDAGVRRPSPHLLDTIFECQQRQEWYRNFARAAGAPRVPVVGSVSPGTPPVDAAARMRAALRFDADQRGGTWSEALRRLGERAEELGVLVMANGVVGSNTHRRLDPREFRGFALADAYAPVAFINGADSKAAQVFTLTHELAHIWLGQSGLDDLDLSAAAPQDAERWCNQVAAELLVPADLLHTAFQPDADLTGELDRLARRFTVSTLVVLRRLRDVGLLDARAFRAGYEAEEARIGAILAERAGSGGDFYNTQPVRTSRRFARALIASTLEGQTLYRDALRLLGLKKLATFHGLAERLGVA
jgi:Zn-dependent peptidase ImmA (M78 family)/transcriptional regulator with XRE-family HTH domain